LWYIRAEIVLCNGVALLRGVVVTQLQFMARKLSDLVTRDRLLAAVRVFGERPADTDALVDALIAAGFGNLESEMLAVFLPLAFGRVALERVGRIDFVETVSARTRRGQWVNIPLHDVPTYVAALALARESYRTRILAEGQFAAVAGWSAEVNVVSDALYKELSIDGAALATALHRVSAEDLGYGNVWSRLWERLFDWKSRTHRS
jgi:hypothetical protein